MEKITYKERHLRVFEKGEICCKDIRRHYGELLEKDLPPSLETRLNDHIKGCQECKEFSQTYLMTIDLAKQLGHVPMPAGVQDRLLKALESKLGLQLGSNL